MFILVITAHTKRIFKRTGRYIFRWISNRVNFNDNSLIRNHLHTKKLNIENTMSAVNY